VPFAVHSSNSPGLADTSRPNCWRHSPIAQSTKWSNVRVRPGGSNVANQLTTIASRTPSRTSTNSSTNPSEVCIGPRSSNALSATDARTTMSSSTHPGVATSRSPTSSMAPHSNPTAMAIAMRGSMSAQSGTPSASPGCGTNSSPNIEAATCESSNTSERFAPYGRPSGPSQPRSDVKVAMRPEAAADASTSRSVGGTTSIGSSRRSRCRCGWCFTPPLSVTNRRKRKRNLPAGVPAPTLKWISSAQWLFSNLPEE